MREGATRIGPRVLAGLPLVLGDLRDRTGARRDPL